MWRPRQAQDGSCLGADAALVVLDADGVGRSLAERLRCAGMRVVEIEPGPGYARETDETFRVELQSAESWSSLFEAVGTISCLVHIDDPLSDEMSNDVVEDSLSRARPVLSLVKAMASRQPNGGTRCSSCWPPSAWFPPRGGFAVRRLPGSSEP